MCYCQLPSRNTQAHTPHTCSYATHITHLQLCHHPPPTSLPPPSHHRCAGLVQLDPCGTRAAGATTEPGGRANNTTHAHNSSSSSTGGRANNTTHSKPFISQPHLGHKNAGCFVEGAFNRQLKPLSPGVLRVLLLLHTPACLLSPVHAGSGS